MRLSKSEKIKIAHWIAKGKHGIWAFKEWDYITDNQIRYAVKQYGEEYIKHYILNESCPDCKT